MINILGHSTSVNVSPLSISAYWSSGDEKCSRTGNVGLEVLSGRVSLRTVSDS